MRVLVTGSHGYLGTVLTSRLIQSGFDVVGLDVGWFEDCELMPAPIVPWIQADIRDLEPSDLRGFDAVLHLAALSNDPLGNLNPELTLDINYRAAVRLARLCKEAGVERFVFSSSCSLYGSAGETPVNEESAMAPVTAYGQSKALVDREVSQLADDRFSPTFLRHATAYGLSPRLRLDLVVNELVALAMTTGRILLKSDGTPWRPLVHAEDIAQIFEVVLSVPRERVHNQAFNVGRSEENYRILQVAEIVRETVPGTRIEIASGAGPDLRCYRVDFSKLERRLPEFKPEWTVPRGAQQLLDAYRRYGLTESVIESSRFYRLGSLRSLRDQGRLSSDLRWLEKAPEAEAVQERS